MGNHNQEEIAVDFLTEREKIEFEHRLKKRRIILDKALWAVVVVILGITANVVFENYKAGLVRERFFLERRYDAVQSIQDAFGDLFLNFDKFTVYSKQFEIPPDYKEHYRRALYNFIKVTNESSILLSEDCDRSAQYLILIFSGFFEKDVAKCRKYKEFGSDVGGWFMDNLLTDLGFKSTKKQDDYDYKGLEAKIYHRINREIGATGFLDQEFEKWKKWRESNERT